jgi:arginase family enzyme
LVVDPDPALASVVRSCQAAERVFVDIDCDVFDTAYFPAAAQPVPFGLSPAVVLRFLEALWSPKVAGVLISEFDPARDHDDRSLAHLIWLIEHLLLRWHESSVVRGRQSRQNGPYNES